MEIDYRIISDTRIKNLNNQDVTAGDYVLYWMRQSQPAEYNHALEYAIRQAKPIFGTVRYMAASGLERKCDIGAYVSKVDTLAKMSWALRSSCTGEIAHNKASWSEIDIFPYRQTARSPATYCQPARRSDIKRTFPSPD